MAPPLRYTDAEIEAALRASDGDLREAAMTLDCCVGNIRIRCNKNNALRALVVPKRPGRPKEMLRVVTTEAIVAALDAQGSVKAAAAALGIRPNAILHRACDQAVSDAIARVARGRERDRAEILRRRRQEIADKIAIGEARRHMVKEMAESWRIAREAWVVEARERGLTLKEMGDILGLTRERVRQLENEVGMRPRTSEVA
jgi:hypothetical protein